jgi:RNA polymerase sigma-70 factor (ECF subfamily)
VNAPEDVVAVVRRHVRLRFALDAATFAGRLTEVARTAAPPAEAPPTRVARLCLDDLYLATACARGEEAAWEECATRHFGFVRDFARRYLREPEAGDLADQVIADLWQRGKIARFDGRSSLRTWLGAVVAHAALNVLKSPRRGAARATVEVESRRRPRDSEAAAVSDGEAAGILKQLVSEALCGMPDEARLLILLHYEQDLTLDEMGLVLGASKSTLSRRLKRTHAALRDAVDAAARARFGASADALRVGVELGRLELELGSLVASGREGPPSRLSNERDERVGRGTERAGT